MKLSSSFQNWISFIGFFIALISLFMIVFLFVLSTFLGEGGAYLGLVIYILLPSVLFMGLALILIGMIYKKRKEKKQGRTQVSKWPLLDLNLKKHRRALLFFSLATTFFLFISALGSYEAFHFTETVSFCGEICHKVMKPEYTAYQTSSHARVSCVECHVGPGAGWYVRSKLSGLYQVYAVLTKSYPKPIPTPVENLRPARDVCEQCHWPQKFYAHKMRFETYYLTDEENTAWETRLVMKIGPEHQALGLKEGIHWHINPEIKIDYYARDDQREDLPWVRYSNLKTGETIIYQDEDAPLERDQLDDDRIRTMDCIDCHNRPSHDYHSPSRFINNAITAGDISQSLPGIKSLSMDLFNRSYSSEEDALETIEQEVLSYYKSRYPDFYKNSSDLIQEAIGAMQQLFSYNLFPEMKVRWDVHPNHIGHLNVKGCFRCHNATHKSKDQEFIRQDCNLCHEIIGQGKPSVDYEAGDLARPLEFRHPIDIDFMWKEILCSECHTGSGM